MSRPLRARCASAPAVSEAGRLRSGDVPHLAALRAPPVAVRVGCHGRGHRLRRSAARAGGGSGVRRRSSSRTRGGILQAASIMGFGEGWRPKGAQAQESVGRLSIRRAGRVSRFLYSVRHRGRMSEHFYAAGRKASAHRAQQAARPPDHRGPKTNGRIVRLMVGQGHGFIRSAEDRDVFFHRSDLHDGTSFNGLAVGDAVTFELFEDKVSGARALRVRPRRRQR
jgi:cold shock CspA family protein